MIEKSRERWPARSGARAETIAGRRRPPLSCTGRRSTARSSPRRLPAADVHPVGGRGGPGGGAKPRRNPGRDRADRAADIPFAGIAELKDEYRAPCGTHGRLAESRDADLASGRAAPFHLRCDGCVRGRVLAIDFCHWADAREALCKIALCSALRSERALLVGSCAIAESAVGRAQLASRTRGVRERRSRPYVGPHA